MAVDHDGRTFPPTGEGLIACLDHAMQAGLVYPSVGANYKTTCLVLLPVALGRDWQAVDLTTLDPADLLDRFQTARGAELDAAGLATYSQRLAGALRLLLTSAS